MNANEPVVVHTTYSRAEAEILKNSLEAQGIRCELEGEHQASFAGVLAVKLLVRAWDESRARKAIASHAHFCGVPAARDEND